MVTLHWRNLAENYLNQVIMANTPITKHVDIMYGLIRCTEKAPHL